MGQNLKQEKPNNSRKKKTTVKIHSYQLSLNETQYWATSDQNQASSFHKFSIKYHSQLTQMDQNPKQEKPNISEVEVPGTV